MTMSELDLKRIEQRSAQLLEKITPYLEREDIWVIAASIVRMMDVAPKLEDLVKGGIMAREAGRYAVEAAAQLERANDVTKPHYAMLAANGLAPGEVDLDDVVEVPPKVSVH